MSHSHRDENDLAQPAVEEPAPVVAPPAPAVVANSEAERRAAERRKAEGVPEQTTQHQFTGDLPEPDRGGTETETRLVFERGGDDDAGAATKQPGSVRRGPPAPRAQLVGDEASWAAPPTFDALGSGSLAVAGESWLAPARVREAALGRAPLTRSWIRLP